MARVALVDVSKSYGIMPVLRDVSLEIADGSFVSIVGPSGCGKSTTLQVIAGLEHPSAGDVYIGEDRVTDWSPRARDVAMVFQSYALYPHMDVRRNLAFPLEVAGAPRATIDERVAEVSALLGLDALLDRRPRALSGGQRQRVALGRALVRRPRAFLFDEPLSNLDAALRTSMRGELKKLHERLGATFVYVTHDQAEAMTLSDQVAVMNEGVVQQVAPPRTLYERPANVFVARFFGSPAINLVPPEVLNLAERGGAVVGVRAEDLAIGAGGPPSGAQEGRVWLTEPLGAETWVTVEVAGERLVVRAEAGFTPAPGTPVWVKAHPERLHWFDLESGARLPR